MEPWQRNHIVSNLSQLIPCTSCTPTLLAKLQAFSILSEDEVELVGLYSTQSDQVRTFYNFMMTKRAGYEKLLEVLKETNQDKAISILTVEMKNRQDNLEVTEKHEEHNVSTDDRMGITDRRQMDAKVLLESEETTHLLTGSSHKTETIQNMEDRQKNIIASNLDDLINLTSCSTLFLKILQTSGTLSNEDFEKLQSIENPTKQSSELYNVILMKRRGFDELVEALKQTCQTGALHILTEGTSGQNESKRGSIELEESCDTHKGGSQPSPEVEAQPSEMPKLKQIPSLPEAVQSFETRIKVYPNIHFVTTPPWLNEFYFENNNMSILSPNVDLTLGRIQSCDVGGSFGNALPVLDAKMEFLVAPLRNPSDLLINEQVYEQHKPKTLLVINKSIQDNLTALKKHLLIKKEYEETITLKDVDILTWNYLSNYFKIQGRPVTVNLKLAFLRDELTSNELYELIEAAEKHNHLELLHELAQPETPLILLFTPRMCLDKEILNENTDNVFFIASDDMPPPGFTNRTVSYYTVESYSEEITADIVVLNGEEPYLQQYEELQDKTNRIGHLVLWKQSHLQLIASTGGINVARKFIQSRNFPHDFNEFYQKPIEFDPRIVILHPGDEHELEQVGLNFSQGLMKADSKCVICTAASSLDSTFKNSSRSDFGTAVLKQWAREQTNLKIEIVIVWKNEMNKRALKNDLLYLKGIRVWIIVGNEYKDCLEDEFNTIAWEVDILGMDWGTSSSVQDPVETDSEHETSNTAKRPKRDVEQRIIIGTDSNKQMSNDSILFIAIRKGVDVDVLDKLVKADADEYQVNFNYENVLHICAMHGHADALEYFLRNSLLVNGLDKNLNTPLHVAVSNNCKNSERIQTLLIDAGADVNAKNVEDLIPLTLAFESGNELSVKVIDMMEQNGLVIKTQPSYENIEKLLFNAAIKDSTLPVAEYLLRKEGISSYPSDDTGQTIFHVASGKQLEKELEIITVLILHSADVNKLNAHLLDGKFLTRLVKGNKQVPDQVEHYIHRTLRNKSEANLIKNAHIYYSLKELFPERAPQLKTTFTSKNELCTLGLLKEDDSGGVRFVHRTFAEFFVAMFAMDMLTKSAKISPFLLDELLATKSSKEFMSTPLGKVELGTSHTFIYPRTAYFINAFTKMYFKNYDHQDQSHRVSLLMDSANYGQVSRILIASAVSDYEFVPFVVSLCFDTLQLNKTGDSDVYELLLVAAKYSSVALMKTFCSQADLIKLQSQSKFDSFELTPLHVALQRGHYPIVEFLANKYETGLTSLRYLAHFCIFESLPETKKIIMDKVKMIKLLAVENRASIDEKAPNGAVPLLQKNVNCELIKCLIECGADVNANDKNGNTILHKISENPVTPEFYHWLVVSLSQRNFKNFSHPNSHKVSPLHCALEKVELLEDTLKYFQLNNSDFNAEDEEKEPPLFYAIRGGRSVSFICALIKFGADWKKRNKNRQTVLHICAKHANYDAMEYFLKTVVMDVNAKDKEENTALHFAVMKRSQVHESMQQLLITCGADVDAEKGIHSVDRVERRRESSYKNSSSKNHTPFEEALRLRKGLSLKIIKLMINHGLSIRERRASEALTDLLSNRNIMSWEIDKEYIQVLQFLIEEGGKIEENLWESKEVQRNMYAVIQATDMSCLWAHVKTSKILTESELQDINSLSTDSLDKCERFYKAIQTKKGSFERVCILLLLGNQMSAFLLLRQFLSLKSKIFVTPPAFTNQFIHSQHNSLEIVALVTTNPFLTIQRIRDTIKESVVVIKEIEISSHLKKTAHEDLIVVKVRVVTSELISKLEEIGTAQNKIIIVCSAVDEHVKHCYVVTDTPFKWDDISTPYFDTRAKFHVFEITSGPVYELFESPLILNKLSQLEWKGMKFPEQIYAVVSLETGHVEREFKSESYLCPKIFHYFLPDKLVFRGVSIEKLKEFSRFGHKIGNFGEDNEVTNLDFLIIEQSHQFDEICKQTSENVHLVEYEEEKGVLKVMKTWGWEKNIQGFLKKPLCKGFPHCDCASDNENLAVRVLIMAHVCGFVDYFDCLLPINELTSKSLRYLKLENAEELFNITALLRQMCEELQVENTGKSHSQQIVKLITEHLSTFLVESELYYVAINTLFPNLAKETIIISGLEKYQQLGMLKPINNKQMVFVHQSLAWFLIAKLLVGLTETTEFEGITGALRNEIFQNCFQTEDVNLADGYFLQKLLVSRNSQKNQLSSYTFVSIICFRFIDALLEKRLGTNNSNISNFLKNIIVSETEKHKWMHACVNANLFHLLQLVISFEIDASSSPINLEEHVVAAINYADLPITRLLAERYEKQTKQKLTDIKLYIMGNEISMVALAAFRGNYSVVQFLIYERGFRSQLEDNYKLVQVGLHCVSKTTNNSGFDINARKCIVDLLFRTDMSLIKQILLSSMRIHVDLIVYLINLGVDIHATDTYGNNILHLCPKYLTPVEYHEVVELIHAKDNTNIYRLFQDFGTFGRTAFHVAVVHLELLDETIALFSEAGVNFNALNKDGNSLFVYAAKHLRSSRLLDTLYRFGADIHARDKNGQPASVYCCNNKTALRYLSSRGVDT